MFLIYVNSKISKFADDTKIASKVTTTGDKDKLQNNLDRRISWAQKWQMNFNVDKFKVLHIGSNNDRVNYSMNSVQLSEADQEKDLGLVISNDLKPNLQCKEVNKKANKLIGFIGKTFEYKSETVTRTLYNSLVQPHLEYCV